MVGDEKSPNKDISFNSYTELPAVASDYSTVSRVINDGNNIRYSTSCT